MIRPDGLREVLAGHGNAVEHFAQLGALLPAVFDLAASGGPTAAEAAAIIGDALAVYANAQRSARRAARLVVLADLRSSRGNSWNLSAGGRACPCGSTNTRLRRFAGQGPPLCAGCYMRRRRAA